MTPKEADKIFAAKPKAKTGSTRSIKQVHAALAAPPALKPQPKTPDDLARDILFELSFVKSPDMKKIKKLIRAGANLEARNDFHRTMLIEAVDKNCVELVKILIGLKVNLDAKDANNNTALHFSLRQRTNHQIDECFELLVNAKAKLDVLDNDHKTPLIYLCEFGWTEWVEMLLKNGAKADIPDKDNLYPMQHAKRRCHYKIVDLLHEYAVVKKQLAAEERRQKLIHQQVVLETAFRPGPVLRVKKEGLRP